MMASLSLFSEAKTIRSKNNTGKSMERADAISVEPPTGLRQRIWRYGPVLLWLAFIFFASSASMSASNTSRFVGPLMLWLDPDITLDGLMFVHYLVRKGAHFIEYAILALLAARAFLTSSLDVLRRQWFIFAFCLVALYSLGDELHQAFVPSRTGTVIDSLIDTAGGTTALIAVALLRTWQQKTSYEETHTTPRILP